jgi:hypothetical protein
MGKRFDEFLERGRKWWPPSFGATIGPPVDVYQENDEIVVRVELPGMDKSDVGVELLGRVLTVKGEKKRRSEIKDKDYYRSEILTALLFASSNCPTSRKQIGFVPSLKKACWNCGSRKANRQKKHQP